jgi:hypothetical protein
MIRNLRILLAAAMALTAFGAVSASGAQAVEFHCSVEPCRVTVKPDGTGKTSHQVVTVKYGGESFSTTCSSITGEGTSSTKTFKELTITNIQSSECKLLEKPAELKMNGCDYLMKATEGTSGSLTITCPAGKEIEAGTVGGGCLYNIPPQGPLKGYTFTDPETSGKKVELTVSTSIPNISVTTNGGCLGIPKGPAVAEYTTGNTILTSETDPGGVMSNLWWE